MSIYIWYTFYESLKYATNKNTHLACYEEEKEGNGTNQHIYTYVNK